MPPPPLRIAILECDTPLPNTNKKYTGYGGVFTSLLHRAATNLSPPLPRSSLHLITYNIVNTPSLYPNLEDIDAILLTGSKHNSFDNDPWILTLVDFVKSVLAQRRVRIIGVCFGHQILGRALGCEVGRSTEGWEVSVLPMELTPKGKEIFGVEELSIHQMHRDIIRAYPPDVESLGFTSKCAVQAMYVPKRFMSVQGHPEFNEEIVREIIDVRHKAGVFDDETFTDAEARVARKQDGLVVAGAFLRFLLED